MFCPWETAQYLFFSSNVPTLLYYSHLVAILAAVVFALLLFSKARESLAVKIFLSSIVFFVIWAVMDIIIWASNDPGFVLFFWSLLILFEILLYVGIFYFAYVVIKKKDIDFFYKFLLVALIAPIVVLLPTDKLLSAIDVAYCNAEETQFVVLYSYSVEIFLGLSILFLGFKEAIKNHSRRKELLFFTLGTLVFLFSFSSGNIIGSLTENWSLAQIGLFGMPIFIAFLTYTVVKFRAFNIKLLGTQAFVASLWLLTLAVLFIRTLQNVRIIVALNLVLATVLGYLLIRGVKKEVALREETQKLAKNLEFANVRQLETMRFITHEVKGYLTDASAGFDAITSESFGPVAPDIKEMSQEALRRVQEGVSEVKNFLHVSDFKTGKVEYAKDAISLKELLMKGFEDMKKRAEAKKLTLTLEVPEGDEFKILGDADYITNHVLKNLIDNAIHYTPEGSVAVSLTRKDGKVLFSVKDSGVGLTDEDKKVLFTEGGRGKDSRAVNVHSTGFGLFIAKQIIDAHHGRVWAESEGRGKGSTFLVEFPGV